MTRIDAGAEVTSEERPIVGSDDAVRSADRNAGPAREGIAARPAPRNEAVRDLTRILAAGLAPYGFRIDDVAPTWGADSSQPEKRRI